MTSVTEVAPDVYRINTFVPEIQLGFSQFLVKDDEPLLFHTGMRSRLPPVEVPLAAMRKPPTRKRKSISPLKTHQ